MLSQPGFEASETLPRCPSESAPYRPQRFGAYKLLYPVVSIAQSLGRDRRSCPIFLIPASLPHTPNPRQGCRELAERHGLIAAVITLYQKVRSVCLPSVTSYDMSCMSISAVRVTLTRT